HDGRWLREDFPGFARDIDWTFFNVAPDDQQFDEEAFALDTSYGFQNLHPTRELVGGRLPNVRARCFVSRAGRAPRVLDEILLRLGTLWFFPARERAVLPRRRRSDRRAPVRRGPEPYSPGSGHCPRAHVTAARASSSPAHRWPLPAS